MISKTMMSSFLINMKILVLSIKTRIKKRIFFIINNCSFQRQFSRIYIFSINTCIEVIVVWSQYIITYSKVVINVFTTCYLEGSLFILAIHCDS